MIHKSLSIQQWASKGLFRNIFDEISSAWMSKTGLFWTSVTHSSCRFFWAQFPLWRPQVVPCSDKLLNSQTINDIYSSMTDNWFSMVSEGELCCNLLKIAPFCFFTSPKRFLLFFNESACLLSLVKSLLYCTIANFCLWTSSSKWLKRAIKMNTSNGLSTLVLVLLE